jgi:hypothetical protein
MNIINHSIIAKRIEKKIKIEIRIKEKREDMISEIKKMNLNTKKGMIKETEIMDTNNALNMKAEEDGERRTNKMTLQKKKGKNMKNERTPKDLQKKHPTSSTKSLKNSENLKEKIRLKKTNSLRENMKQKS